MTNKKKRNKANISSLYTIRNNPKQLLVWIITVVVSIIFIFVGNSMVSKDLDIFNVEGAYCEKALVVELLDKVDETLETSGMGMDYVDSTQYFNAKVLTGDFKGKTVLAAQTSDNYTSSVAEPAVAVGDKVILYNYGQKQGNADWVFGGYARLIGPVVLGIAFCVLLIIFGLFKGINTLVSLTFTCLAVFAVFVPSVLNGYNIYTMTAITCIYTIIMTLLITNGATQKSLTTILGCSFGVLVAAILELVFDKALRLTGMLDEHSIYITYLEPANGHAISLNGLIFAMVVIGAMGAVMDVAMDISSSLSEVHIQAPQLKFRQLFMSGIRIGRDIMGTMANTLVLAYIGSSLCSTLLLITYSSSLYELLNREGIVIELLQSLIGSTAILLTIPLTSLVCALLYTRDNTEKSVVKAADNKIEFDSHNFVDWKTEVNRQREEDLTKIRKESENVRSLIPDKDPVFIYNNDKDKN